MITNRRKPPDGGDALADCVLILLGGWALMLGLGIVHHEAAVTVPALGYFTSLALVCLARLVKHAIAPRVPTWLDKW